MPLLSHSLTTEEIKQLVSVIDLTSLTGKENIQTIQTLCQQATTPIGNVAAVCSYPEFVPIMRDSIKDSSIKIATVANFPEAIDDIQTTVKSIKHSIKNGADEIDIVTPSLLRQTPKAEIITYLKECRKACGPDITLKVILETGSLQSNELIRLASQIAIDAGANFIKTSTGKIGIGATLEAAEIMLSVIKENNKPVGLKVSGGIRTADDAQQYLQLTREMMGDEWINKSNFRIGASVLLQNLLKQGQ